MSDWQTLDTAPKVGVFEVRGKTDATATRERVIKVQWNDVYKAFVTKSGWIVLASAWRPMRDY